MNKAFMLIAYVSSDILRVLTVCTLRHYISHPMTPTCHILWHYMSHPLTLTCHILWHYMSHSLTPTCHLLWHYMSHPLTPTCHIFWHYMTHPLTSTCHILWHLHSTLTNLSFKFFQSRSLLSQLLEYISSLFHNIVILNHNIPVLIPHLFRVLTGCIKWHQYFSVEKKNIGSYITTNAKINTLLNTYKWA